MSGLKNKIKTAPQAPGVYLFKNDKNKTIYIGKAANLKNRLSSYLSREDNRNRILMSHTVDIDIIITNSDVEALTLEESLIKLNKPRYNVRLKDDKKFPYLKITVHEEFPRIVFTRNIKPDGSLIFGPYTSARALRQTRDALCRIFKLVSCSKDLAKSYTRPCLEYNLDRCSAPCVGQINKKEYRNFVNKAIKFLKGSSDELEREIERRMWECAKKEKFKAAAILRDQLLAIRRISQRQQVVTTKDINRDVIGISRSRFSCVACLFRIRENRLMSKEIFHLKISSQISDEEIASSFIRLIYTHLSFIPDEIAISVLPFEWDIQSKWFREKGFKVKISTGNKEENKRLLKWAQRNADSELAKRVIKRRTSGAIFELQNHLQLEKPPRWIEAFDVSNLKEKFAVGSSVAFRDGKPYKQRYRRYKIKRVRGQNDFAMIKEIVSRRVMDLDREKKMPDLLLIDGGKGQLSAAIQAIREIDITVPIFAIAKRSDQLFDAYGNVVSIPGSSRGLILLKRLRDEAHRFAIGYHRKVRGKKITESILDKISSIGEKRKLTLLKYFGSTEAINKASEEDIAKVPNIGKKIAKIIYESLHT
ncbi:MAG: excinuclease ABC subunit UvrC [Candidatus Stahlbacteria bacterium]|nr:MAG: excinuclease ABC subunit UvrC [Candidatus Stahlbacteria bacterium]